MNIELITSVVVGCFIYNIILKAIGNAILNKIVQGREKEILQHATKETFAEKLIKKQEEQLKNKQS